MTGPVRAEALLANAAGLCALPPRQDGSKRPAFACWTEYQARRSTAAEVAAWWANGRTGLGLVTGTVSGNVEALDFDDAATYCAFVEAADALGLGDLVRRIADGYSDATPGDGYRWLYRCAEIAGNTKLAQRPGPPDAQRRPTREVLIETRGEGGYAVVAPSHGTVHPTGKPYARLAGAFATIATITPEERGELFRLARSFDAMPRQEEAPRQARGAPPTSDGTRPGDDFAARTDWGEILLPHGWARLFTRNGTTFWRRPGKSEGWSATTNYAGADLLYVFSGSTPFQPERGYGKFGAFAVLNHGGDHRAAARDLAARGYGTRREGARFTAGPKAAPPRDQPGDNAPDGGAAPDDLPTLDAGDHHLPRITGLAWEALYRANDPPRLFRFAGLVSRLERDDQGAPAARTLTEDRLRHELARAATWQIARKDAVLDALPPMAVVRDLLATPDPRLPILDQITEVPIFAPDGSLQLTLGYAARSRAYYAPPAGFTVPAVADEPDAADVARARDLITQDLLGDFPFVDAPELAHAVGLLILPFVRALIHGPTPLHLIEKPMPGTGASLLADALTLPALGRPVAAMTEGRDEDEWRKRITARLRSGATAILIDNLRERLETASLAAALTSTHWEDRLLGTSDTLRLPVRCAWIATGNNPALSSEIARRTVRIRLDARSDRPWLRRGFRHPNLRAWLLAHRADLVWAALTLGQAWLADGKPIRDDAPALGMFEEWSRVVGGVLETAGIAGFLLNLGDFYDQADTEGATLRAFVAAWWETHGERAVGVADLFRLIVQAGIDLDLGDKGERSQRIRLGRIVGNLRDRHYPLPGGGTVRIVAAGMAQRAQLWRLIGIEGE